MNMIEKSLKNQLKGFDEERGSLLPLEFKNIGFIPQRIFVVNNVPVGEIRGNHSHHMTQQYLICVDGKVKVFLDDGDTKEVIDLEKNESVLIPPLVWDSQQFLTKNAAILVICSTEYNIDDYIMNYEEFSKIIKRRKVMNIENNER